MQEEKLTSHVRLLGIVCGILDSRVDSIAHVGWSITRRRPGTLPAKHTVDNATPLLEPCLRVLVALRSIRVGDEVDLSIEVILHPRLKPVGANATDTERAHDGVIVGTSPEIGRPTDVVCDNLRVGIDVAGLVEVETEEELEACGVGMIEKLADGARRPWLTGLADVEGESFYAQGLGLVYIKLCMTTAFCDSANLGGAVLSGKDSRSGMGLEVKIVPCSGNRLIGRRRAGCRYLPAQPGLEPPALEGRCEPC
jgi:hypothetical protein